MILYRNSGTIRARTPTSTSRSPDEHPRRPGRVQPQPHVLPHQDGRAGRSGRQHHRHHRVRAVRRDHQLHRAALADRHLRVHRLRHLHAVVAAADPAGRPVRSGGGGELHRQPVRHPAEAGATLEARHLTGHHHRPGPVPDDPHPDRLPDRNQRRPRRHRAVRVQLRPGRRAGRADSDPSGRPQHHLDRPP